MRKEEQGCVLAREDADKQEREAGKNKRELSAQAEETSLEEKAVKKVHLRRDSRDLDLKVKRHLQARLLMRMKQAVPKE